MPASPNLEPVFLELRRILAGADGQLVVTADSPSAYSLNAPVPSRERPDLFFGAVQVHKHYVSFYLMPVYMYPDLLQGISEGLKKRMQGKSCFNFKEVDETLFAELAGLTRQGIEAFRQRGIPETVKTGGRKKTSSSTGGR